VRLAGDPQPLAAEQITGTLPADGPAFALVRPHDLRLLGPTEHGGSRALLRNIAVVGSRLRLILEKSGQTIEAEADRDRVDASWLHPGAQLRIELRRVRIFAADGDAALPPAVPDPVPSQLSHHPARAALR
jgi:hypothetical protein